MTVGAQGGDAGPGTRAERTLTPTGHPRAQGKRHLQNQGNPDGRTLQLHRRMEAGSMRKGPWSDRWPGIPGEGREGGQEDTGLTCELRLGAQRPRRGEEGRGREEGQVQQRFRSAEAHQAPTGRSGARAAARGPRQPRLRKRTPQRQLSESQLQHEKK